MFKNGNSCVESAGRVSYSQITIDEFAQCILKHAGFLLNRTKLGLNSGQTVSSNCEMLAPFTASD